jgi:hypothetical protein
MPHQDMRPSIDTPDELNLLFSIGTATVADHLQVRCDVRALCDLSIIHCFDAQLAYAYPSSLWGLAQRCSIMISPSASLSTTAST